MSESKKKLFDAEQNQNLIKSLKLPGYILKYTSRFEEENRLTPPVRMRVKQSSEVKNNPIISNKLTHQRLENNCCIIGPGQPIETDVRVIQTIQVKEFSRDESYQLRNRAETHNCTDKVHSSKQNSQQYKFAKDIKKPAPKNEWIYIKGNHDGSQELLTYVPKKFEEKSRPVPLVERYAEEFSEFNNCPIINKEIRHLRIQNRRHTIESVQPNEADMKDIQTIPLDVKVIQELSKNDSSELKNKTEANNTTENIHSCFDTNKQYETFKDTIETTPFEKGNMRQLFDTEQCHIRNQEDQGYVLNYCHNCLETSKPESLVSSGAEESCKVEYNQNNHHESINEKLGNNYYPVKTGQPIESEIKTIQSKTLAGGRTDESFNKEKSHHETKNILSSIAKDTQHKIAKDTATLISSDGKSAEGLFESAEMHIEKK
ncbi:uncharacterized protein LOC119669152 [Teleopsis dalmanni]|uniref:uncharacterized protein LOC119669152 n=1 Tax=Teleopsis dalmanni TaxID=139649 RepID=UPI0018CE25E2|nr:uncharacterized protein LOC119669152 [Teleopsis dalmanni]